MAQMIEQAKNHQPNECCGLLGGMVANDGLAMVLGCFPLINAAHSPVLFESDPRSIFEATRAIDQQGWQLLAIYHSHPTSEPIPSRTDLERSYDPEVMNLILSLQHDPVLIRAWWLLPDSFTEADWEVVDEPIGP
jgi:proteasome lid subunit RPN8/RPN11